MLNNVLIRNFFRNSSTDKYGKLPLKMIACPKTVSLADPEMQERVNRV